MSVDWSEIFASGVSYAEFLEKYGTEAQQQRWSAKRASLALTPPQTELLGRFTRKMHVLCMAGAWCGDCVDQCPMFDLIASASPEIEVRFVDRDDCDETLKEHIKVCGGNRVPVVLFLSEDFQQTGMYGDRTLAKYRQIVENVTGAACSTGITLDAAEGMDELTTNVLAEWIDQFERNQWILRTSARLREKHGD